MWTMPAAYCTITTWEPLPLPVVAAIEKELAPAAAPEVEITVQPARGSRVV
jgi:hypothetical protein